MKRIKIIKAKSAPPESIEDVPGIEITLEGKKTLVVDQDWALKAAGCTEALLGGYVELRKKGGVITPRFFNEQT